MQRIKSVGVLSLGLYWGVGTFIMMLMFGLLALIGANSLINAFIATGSIKVVAFSTTSLWSLVTLSFGAGLGGFVTGVVLALVFNLIAALTGGIKIRLEK